MYVPSLYNNTAGLQYYYIKMVHTITYVIKNLLIEIKRPVIVLWLQVGCYIPPVALGVMDLALPWPCMSGN